MMRLLTGWIFLAFPVQNYIQAQIARSSCKKEATFKLVKRDTILNAGMFGSQNMASLPQCAIRCVHKTGCESFNYNPTRKLCQLLIQTQKTSGAKNLQSSVGWMHYEPVVREPLARLGCNTEPCGVFEKCVEDCSKLPYYTCQALQNIALGKPAVDAPAYPGYRPASRAVDGNTNSNWYGNSCSHTTCCSVLPWWRVDFGKTAKVYSMKVTNRGDCCGERLSDFNIRIGDSAQGRGELNTACQMNVGVGAGATKTFVCKPPLNGRYLYIQTNKGLDLTICELQAFGEIL